MESKQVASKGTLSSESISSQPEDKGVQLLKKTLAKTKLSAIINNPELCSQFIDFLREFNGMEYLSCWFDIENYKKSNNFPGKKMLSFVSNRFFRESQCNIS